MAKKMNATEFKEALTSAGLDFGIYGYEGILNALSMFYDHQAEKDFNRGADAVGKHEKKIANKLYGTLCRLGYYTH